MDGEYDMERERAGPFGPAPSKPRRVNAPHRHDSRAVAAGEHSWPNGRGFERGHRAAREHRARRQRLRTLFVPLPPALPVGFVAVGAVMSGGGRLVDEGVEP
ncbi:hypothetical protein DIE18_20490 [Burkholderia sp. Bp9125]|nr:hypothetical protein DIE18_20490 [Burkholderia sp. Bp9125]